MHVNTFIVDIIEEYRKIDYLGKTLVKCYGQYNNKQPFPEMFHVLRVALEVCALESKNRNRFVGLGFFFFFRTV